MCGSGEISRRARFGIWWVPLDKDKPPVRVQFPPAVPNLNYCIPIGRRSVSLFPSVALRATSVRSMSVTFRLL